jgi:CRP-like cAMP-binding protein
LRPGERVDFESERCYIVTRGTGMLTREGPGGHEILLRMLSPGQVVRGAGTLRADSSLEILALPEGAII